MSRYVIDAAIAAKWIILDPLYSLTILAGGEGGFSPPDSWELKPGRCIQL